MHLVTVLLKTLRLKAGPAPEQLQAMWRKLRVNGLQGVVDCQGVALWLYRRLRESGAAALAEPGCVARLRVQATEDAVINMRVDAQTHALVQLLGSAGTPFVLLKGAARRATAGVYPYADARRTRDVDVLLPADRARQAWEALVVAGYEPAYDAVPVPVDHFHLLPLWNRNRVAVELHTSTSSTVPTGEAWRRANTGATRVRWKGHDVVVPSATELLWHGLSHAMQEGPYGFRLRHLLDASAILASDALIRWDEIMARIGADELLDEEARRGVDRDRVMGWLACAAVLAGVILPPEIPGSPRPFSIERILRWELAVLQHPRLGRAVTEKFLEEGTRCEAGLPLTPAVRSRALPVQWRRRLAALGAREAYRLWRVLLPRLGE